MAVFGLPGGAEWLLIGTVGLLLFVPGLGFGLLGYVLGRRSAGRERVALKPGGYAAGTGAASPDGTPGDRATAKEAAGSGPDTPASPTDERADADD